MEDTVEIVKIPEGESGRIVGRLTEKNLEAIAALYALPEAVRRRKHGDDAAVVRHLARQLGVSAPFIRRARRDKRVRARIWEGLTEALDFLFPTIVYHQVERALPPHNDTKSARFIGELLHRIKDSGGVNVNVNQNNATVSVNLTKDGGISEDKGNLEWLREFHESGDLKRLLTISGHVTEKTPVEQADAGTGEPAPIQP